MFRSVSESAYTELELRRNGRANLCHFGIKFLDDALIGISPSDLILLGAPSGMGKTQICCNIALANMAEGRKVRFIALEAEDYEIERRLKFQVLAMMYLDPLSTIRVPGGLSYDRWVLGDFVEQLKDMEKAAADFVDKCYKDMFVLYKKNEFTPGNLVESVLYAAKETDLFIIDHAHYFDLEDDNDNRAMKHLARTVRSLALEQKKPIILVAHLRKRDKGNEDLVAGLDEFHGSSDLAKIATKVITIAPGGRTSDGCYETFFRIPKNRQNGGVTRFVGKLMFDPRMNNYEKKYKVGDSNLTRKTGFEEFDPSLQPEWAR